MAILLDIEILTMPKLTEREDQNERTDEDDEGFDIVEMRKRHTLEFLAPI